MNGQRCGSAFLVTLLAACAGAPREDFADAVSVRVATGELPRAALEALRTAPSSVPRSVRQERGALVFTFPRDRELELRGPGVCTLKLAAHGPSNLELTPRITLSAPAADVGYDSRFEIRLNARCPGDARGSVSWEVAGAALSRWQTTEGGLRFIGRTRRAPAALAAARVGDVVALSAAERAETRVTARFTSPDGAVTAATVSIVAAPRSSGLSNVALGERVLLAGRGYRVSRRPPGAVADAMPWGELTSLVPDMSGLWLLESAARETRLFVSRYDEVPLDCGRADCHVAVARAAELSPMTHAYKRLLDEPLSPEALVCSQGCHTTGAPGRTDGGFSHALTTLELDASELPSWSALPRSLRRVGGVTCLACHGPGHPPEPPARWAILRGAVCATCHDAPPRYGHVRALSGSRLALSDAELATRTSAACARCHTSWGFIDAISDRRDGRRMPPEDAAPEGITCAACHAVHDERAVPQGLLRRAPLAELYLDLPASGLERSSACIYCHTPSDATGPSSAAIWAGRGASDPITGAALLGPAPHAAVPGGCVGCHRAGPAELERGRSHAFRADVASCSACHAEQPRIPVLERAEQLLARLGDAPRSLTPPHADGREPHGVRERARALILFVLEDRGAQVHNPRYAEALLDRAEQALGPLP